MRRRISLKAQKPPTKTTTQTTILLHNFASRNIYFDCILELYRQCGISFIVTMVLYTI